MKTFMAKPGDMRNRKWYILDTEGRFWAGLPWAAKSRGNPSRISHRMLIQATM